MSTISKTKKFLWRADAGMDSADNGIVIDDSKKMDLSPCDGRKYDGEPVGCHPIWRRQTAKTKASTLPASASVQNVVLIVARLAFQYGVDFYYSSARVGGVQGRWSSGM